MAELNAYTGLSYSSPHSQNFLIELDKNMKPTGRIVFRDLGDSNMQRKFVKLAGRDKLLDAWDKDHLKVSVHAKVGILKSNDPPSWLSDKAYKQWGKDFYAEYEKTLSGIIGVPVSELEKTKLDSGESGYFRKAYETKDVAWKRFFDIASCLSPKRPARLKNGQRCTDILNSAKDGARKALKSEQSTATAVKAYPARTAAEIWNDLEESSFTRKPTPIGVSHTFEVVSYGGEKEGSSSIITRVMGPDRDGFAKYVADNLDDKERAAFLREFLSGWMEGRYRENDVRDVNGMSVRPNTKLLEGVDFKRLNEMELKQKFAYWLEQVGERPFSFIRSDARRKIFRGEFAGLNNGLSRWEYWESFASWVPHLATPDKYLTSAHGTSTGWEINFKPQKTYAEFEEMIDWFQDALRTKSGKFEAPGHHWLVYPKRPGLSPAQTFNLENRLKDLYKNIQAYIVLKGIEGKSGMELSRFKNVLPDEKFQNEQNTSRGVIRVQNFLLETHPIS